MIRQDILDMVKNGLPQTEDELNGDEWDALEACLFDIQDTELSLEEAVLLASCLPLRDFSGIYNSTIGDAIFNSSSAVRYHIIQMNKKSDLLRGIKIECIYPKMVFQMQCGAKYNPEDFFNRKIDDWFGQIPETVLSSSDFRFILVFLRNFEYYDSILSVSHIKAVIEHNYNARSVGWFSPGELDVVNSWMNAQTL